MKGLRGHIYPQKVPSEDRFNITKYLFNLINDEKSVFLAV